MLSLSEEQHFIFIKHLSYSHGEELVGEGKIPSACTARNLSFHQSSQWPSFLIHSIPPCHGSMIPSVQLLLCTCSLNIWRAGNPPLAFYGPYLLIVVIFLSICFRIYPEILSLNQSLLNTSCSKNPKEDSSELLIFYSNPVLDWSVKMGKICFTSGKVHSVCIWV